MRLAAELTALAPDLADATNRLFERITTPNWVLEWNLAPWLGESFRLGEHIRRELQDCNIYVLAFARITDDLIDGEAPRSNLRLAIALQSMIVRRFTGLFAATRDSRPPDGGRRNASGPISTTTWRNGSRRVWAKIRRPGSIRTTMRLSGAWRTGARSTR
ncbi:MAG TPA: hypothetical protein VF014_06525 [Casimicrobiaceae bacterium]|nr:hypothetical protein [Casimicrobiaceae bacterium]